MNIVRDIGEAAAIGEFVEVVPHSRVVFTWGWERDLFGAPPASTRVEVSLTPDGDGTLVRLVHSELSERGVEVHDAGWRHYLKRLSMAAAGRGPAPDDWLAAGLD